MAERSTIENIKTLRQQTGAGMSDCKKALSEGRTFEEAKDWLRKKGLVSAGKKSDRITAQGLVSVAIKNNSAVILELNSETDFVARNAQFQSLLRQITECALDLFLKNHKIDLGTLISSKLSTGLTVEEAITDNIAAIGENLKIRRVQGISIEDGIIASYVHNHVADNIGQIAVLVAIKSNANKDSFQDLGKQIAMHIAALKPHTLDKSGIEDATIQKEKEIFIEQSRASGKTDDIIAKMVDGRIRKFLEEVVLLEQTFVMDGKTKIADLLAQKTSELGTEVKIADFIRYEIGEGIEVEQQDFASEVEAITKQ